MYFVIPRIPSNRSIGYIYIEINKPNVTLTSAGRPPLTFSSRRGTTPTHLFLHVYHNGNSHVKTVPNVSLLVVL